MPEIIFRSRLSKILSKAGLVIGLLNLLLTYADLAAATVTAEGKMKRRELPGWGSDISSLARAPNGLGATVKKDTLSGWLIFSGFIKHDIFYDTRQTVNAREALVTLYPEKVLLDRNGTDINARHSINMLNIHSRLRCEVRGPSVLGAETAALVEADFYGNENKNFSDLNGLRLFNAHIGFRWKTTHLQLGQDWHPMSIQGFFPGVVSFSAGAPFHPMSRNPQIRLRQAIGRFKVMGALLSQRDFTGTGPAGPGSQYLRNSGIPNLHVQAVYASDSSIISAGVGLDFKKIVPELFTSNDKGEIFKTNSGLASVSATCFMELRAKWLTLKVQGVYAQNAYDQLMIGGYGVSRGPDVATGNMRYANLNTLSSWADVQSAFKKFSFGVFSGYTGNLGASRSITGSIYARGGEIKRVYRFAPRVIYTVGHVGISLEGEHTTAFYGVENGYGKGGVTQADAVSNFRALLSVKYSF